MSEKPVMGKCEVFYHDGWIGTNAAHTQMPSCKNWKPIEAAPPQPSAPPDPIGYGRFQSATSSVPSASAEPSELKRCDCTDNCHCICKCHALCGQEREEAERADD